MPALSRSSGVSIACDVKQGMESKDSTPPRLGATRTSETAFEKRLAPSSPP